MIAEGMRCNRPPSVTRKNRIITGYDDDDDDLQYNLPVKLSC